jgi:hypothetical protein
MVPGFPPSLRGLSRLRFTSSISISFSYLSGFGENSKLQRNSQGHYHVDSLFYSASEAELIRGGYG